MESTRENPVMLEIVTASNTTSLEMKVNEWIKYKNIDVLNITGSQCMDMFDHIEYCAYISYRELKREVPVSDNKRI